jgi:ABC-type nitrate/sulfonate/bicarbonate transport system substrate-binding protein
MKVPKSLLAVAIAIVLTTAVRAADKTEVRLGWLRSSFSLLLHPVAMELGTYAKNGIEPKVTIINSGTNASGIESLLRGDLDFVIGVTAETARLDAQAIEIGKKPPLVVVALGSPGATFLVLRKEIPFNDIRDIKSLRLGVSSLSSAHLVTFREFLNEKNLSVEQLSLRLVPLSGNDMPGALLSGQIDGFIHSQPTPSIAINTGAAKVVLKPQELGTSGMSPNVALITRVDWAKEHRDVVSRMVQSLRDASDLYPSLPVERVVEIAQKYLGGDSAVLATSAPYVNPRLVDDFAAGADAWWRVEMAAMKKRGEVDEKFRKEDMFDFSFGR